MARMACLRKRLAGWEAPVHFCGDYLDGPSGEGRLSPAMRRSIGWLDGSKNGPRGRHNLVTRGFFCFVTHRLLIDE